MRNLFSAFKDIDQLRAIFNESFKRRIYAIMRAHNPQFVITAKIDEIVLQYAIQIQNITDSIIDKDRNYPIYRLEEEFEMMKKLTRLHYPTVFPVHLYDVLFNEIKAFMVECNKGVYHLSGLGFRLLDANAKIILTRFVHSSVSQFTNDPLSI